MCSPYAVAFLCEPFGYLLRLAAALLLGGTFPLLE